MTKEYAVNGKLIPLYTIGKLAFAIGRDTTTVREWERNGIIPRAGFRNKRGERLYTRAEIEALERIVNEENVQAGVALANTKLTQRAFAEWKRLRESEEFYAKPGTST